MNYDFATRPDRRGTGSLKWERYAGRDVLPMWVADMDFLSPPEVIEALAQRAAHGVFGYTVPPASTVEAAIDYLRTRHGAEVAAEQIVWFPGLVPALNIACRAFVRPGEKVLICTPVYPPFLSAPDYAGVGLRKCDLRENGGTWEIDFDALEAAVTPETRLFLLCNPHNPVGRVFPEAAVAQVAEFCRRHDLVMVSDEIHCDLVLDDLPHTSGLKFAGPDAPRTLAMFAPSKTFNLAGLACAFIVIPHAETRRAFQRAARGIITEVNAFGYAGCEAALRHGWPWREQLLGVLRSNRDRVEEFCATIPGLRTWHVEATYLAWIDARGTGIEKPAAFFEDHGIGLSDGAPFGAPAGFLRLNFGCPRTQLDEALRRMAQAVASR
ncbi:MAG: putative C-S lyase [Chthoniobacterales bacterium]|nr:putative C-S lyase [Chthoniobacterales bacterium]